MPNEKIAETFIDNGNETYVNSLRVVWGPKGGAPDAPSGWVNAGFAEIGVCRDNGNTGATESVVIGAAEMDHLIRVLKKIRRRTFDKNQDLS